MLVRVERGHRHRRSVLLASSSSFPRVGLRFQWALGVVACAMERAQRMNKARACDTRALLKGLTRPPPHMR